MATVTLEQSNAVRKWVKRFLKLYGYRKDKDASLADIVAYVQKHTGYKPSRSTVKRIIEGK